MHAIRYVQINNVSICFYCLLFICNIYRLPCNKDIGDSLWLIGRALELHANELMFDLQQL